jgi:hypothetical protein
MKNEPEAKVQALNGAIRAMAMQQHVQVLDAAARARLKNAGPRLKKNGRRLAARIATILN